MLQTMRAAIGLMVLLGDLAAAFAQAQDSPPAGQRVFTCAHSFHAFVPAILSEIAKSACINDHAQVGMSSIGGSSVIKHWDVPEDNNKAKAALREGKVDVLTLSPIWLPEDGIEKFATLAFEHNPNVHVTVQEFWLPNDEYVPKYPLDTTKQVDHNAATMAELRRHHEAYFKDFDNLAREINQKLGKPVVRIVPVGQAVLALREKVIAGTAPGIATQAELFTDSWGHVSTPIKVLDAYCHYAVIYGRSPVGLPMPEALAKASQPTWSDEKLNRLLQELAWDAVTQHPLSGVEGKQEANQPK